MSNESPPKTNIDLLLTYLQPEALAGRLVICYTGVETNGRADALKNVIALRRAEIAGGYTDVDDKQN